MRLSEALELRKKGTIISITGGGGKTTTLFTLAEELREHKVLITTTTKILKPQINDLYDIIIEENTGQFIEFLKTGTSKNVIVYSRSYIEKSGKLDGCSPDFITKVKPYFDYILIEADGAAGKPLKAPAEHEPVISPLTDIYIAVIGLDCLGKIADKEHVHRPEYLGAIRGKNENEIVTGEDLVRLINSSTGLFKEAPQSCKKVLLLNKSDMVSKEEGLKLSSEISHGVDFPLDIIMNSYKSKETVIFLN
jgi:probable selenium-dependent hydroxylase accessory protein YqeC